MNLERGIINIKSVLLPVPVPVSGVILLIEKGQTLPPKLNNHYPITWIKEGSLGLRSKCSLDNRLGNWHILSQYDTPFVAHGAAFPTPGPPTVRGVFAIPVVLRALFLTGFGW